MKTPEILSHPHMTYFRWALLYHSGAAQVITKPSLASTLHARRTSRIAAKCQRTLGPFSRKRWARGMGFKKAEIWKMIKNADFIAETHGDYLHRNWILEALGVLNVWCKAGVKTFLQRAGKTLPMLVLDFIVQVWLAAIFVRWQTPTSHSNHGQSFVFKMHQAEAVSPAKVVPKFKSS